MLRSSEIRWLLAIVVVSASTGCAPRRGPVAPVAPAPPPRDTSLAPAAPLPSIPSVIGPIVLRVVYPTEGQLILARDSNFIFGSTGSGGVQLRIDGVSIPVLPNGAFLAYLPVPERSQSSYHLEAWRGADTVRLSHRVAILPPRLFPADTGALQVDSGSVQPRGPQQWTTRDTVRVSVRAPRNATTVQVTGVTGSRPLVNMETVFDSVPNADGRRGGRTTDPYFWATDVPAVFLSDSLAAITVRRDGQEVRLPIPGVRVHDGAPVWAELVKAKVTVPDTDQVIVARPVTGGTYKWFLLPGTVVELTGRAGNAARIRLDRSLEVWVDAAEVHALPSGVPAPRRVTANARVVAGQTGEWSDLIIPVSERPAYAVDEGERTIAITLYDTRANTDIVNYATADRAIERVTWEQTASDRARFTMWLRQAPYGYLVLWERGSLVVRVRRSPVVDREHPLAGLRIAVDAGHPPGGSTGPTGYYEAVATLAIAQRVQSLLEQRGASVIMTRTAPAAVALELRPVMARRADAHAFVSIHLNALPDGVNPFISHGTGTYYFNAHSLPLAREVQRGMVRQMGLRDLGTNYDNLAVLRPTWMPAILCEGAFIMLPEQEAALRTAEFQQRYAEGVVEGIERYFRGLAVPDTLPHLGRSRQPLPSTRSPFAFFASRERDRTH